MTIGEIIPVQDYDWMIHEHDSRFKVKSGQDGTTVYETTDLIDALGAFDYCTTAGGLTVVKKRTHATNTWYPVSGAITVGSNDYLVGLSGKMVTNVEIRPTNNTPAIILPDNALRASVENLLFTHDQAGYTKNMIQLTDTVREVMLSGLRFQTTGAGIYKGNGIGFEIITENNAQYEIVVENIICRDMENFVHFNLQQIDLNPNPNFISSIIFNQCFPWNCKRVVKAQGITGAKLLAITFDNIHFQWSASNDVGVGGAIYDFNDLLSSWQMKMSNCMTWDFPTNVNCVNMGASTELMAMNSNITRVGGNATGIPKMKILEYYNHVYGVFETNAVVGQRDYTITHNLGQIPKEVYCTNISQDINNQFAVIVPKSSITSTSFTARLVGGSGGIAPGTNNLKFAWRVYY